MSTNAVVCQCCSQATTGQTFYISGGGGPFCLYCWLCKMKEKEKADGMAHGN